MKGVNLFFVTFSMASIFFANVGTTVVPEKELCCSAIQAAFENSKIPSQEKIELLDSEVLKCTSRKKVLETECFKFFANAYLDLGQERKFLQLAKNQIKRAKEQSYTETLANGYIILGNHYKKKSQKDSAYYYFFRGYKEVSSVRPVTEPSEIGWLLHNMADIQESTKDYTSAEKNTVEAIRWFSVDNEPKSIFYAYNLLAITQNGLNKFDETLEYHLKAKAVIPEIEDERDRSIYALINDNNIASTHLRANRNLEALKLFNDLLQNEDELNALRPTTLSKALAGRAEAKLRLGSYSEEEIIMDLDKAYDVANDLDSKYTLAMINNYYARTYLAFGKKEIALDKALIAKELAEESENNDRLLEILQFLAENEFEGSSKYAKAYFELNEQLTLEERNIQEKFARIQFESDEKEQENTKLSKQKELLVGIAAGLLLLALGVITIVAQRINNQKLKFEKTQQESNQEIYNLMLTQKGKVEEGKKSEKKRISEELHDGILGQMLGIRLILSGLNERNDEEAIAQRSELIDKLQELEEEIRIISHELSDEAYKKVDNFILALRDLIDTSEKSGNVTIHSSFDDCLDWNTFSSELKINSYRIIQEVLQNCIKHAQGKNIYIELQKLEESLLICIKDDGIGYRASRTKKGIGLKNIISRTNKLKGKVTVDSQIGKGTKVEVVIPLHIPLTSTPKVRRKDFLPT